MLIAAAVILGLLVVAEVALRAYGVGRPVVRLWHHTIEYLQKPSCAYRIRFNRIAYNRWSMRGENFPREKPPGQRRIIILGDSVVDGSLVRRESGGTGSRVIGRPGGTA